MANCPRCSSAVRENARFCDHCGAELTSSEEASTVTTPERPAHGHRSARFVPGMVLAGRYRVVAPVGRGGMGEVYRAEDLKLGQTIALKLLPRSLESDPERRERLLDEVKAARQVSHPNVCRVWDVGEADGLRFVTMEYVDGEDLGSLLRRIGRLPEDRGVRVAREICAGLAAIHGQGLLHRDLKPSNVMLDGRGHVRITDFGLAAHADTVVGPDIRSGTPAYMAPEALGGLGVTARSDVYSLGLVLYELFTGLHAFDSVRTAGRRDAESRPEMPSSVGRTLDPTVEHAILRCLETDPAQRPGSAIAVAQSLPGGDPLAAALSVGETPSPEVVAAAGGVGGLSAPAVLGALAFAAAALIGVLGLSESRGLPFGRDDRSYAVLQDRASELMRVMGSGTNGGQMQDGFSRMTGIVPELGPGPARNDVFYWQRRSPTVIVPVVEERLVMGGSRYAIPALEAPGEMAARFDLQGRLLEFRRIPQASDTAASRTPDFGPLFTAAGLTGATPVEPARVPAPVATDARQAWVVHTPQGDRGVEGGSYMGRVTFFAVGPRYAPPSVGLSNLMGGTIASYVVVLLFAMSLIVAWRNLAVGRADVRGAACIGAIVFLVGSFGFAILNDPQLSWPGSDYLIRMTALGVYYTLFTSTSYLALEPIVRRREPRWLTSWNRLLDGRWRDPLVGQHVVIGVIAGLMMALVSGLREYIAHTAAPGDFQAAAIGGWASLGVVCRGVVDGMQIALLFALILVLLRLAVRLPRLAFVAWLAWGLLYGLLASGIPHAWAGLGLVVVFCVLAGLVLHHFGVLASMVATTVWTWLNEEYLTLHLGAWYAGVTVAAVIAIAVLLGWGTIAGLRVKGEPRGA